jgi:hypothetical protein
MKQCEHPIRVANGVCAHCHATRGIIVADFERTIFDLRVELERYRIQLAAITKEKDDLVDADTAECAALRSHLAAATRRLEMAVEALELARSDLAGLSSNWARDVAARIGQAIVAIRAPEEKLECTCEPMSMCGPDPNCPQHGAREPEVKR